MMSVVEMNASTVNGRALSYGDVVEIFDGLFSKSLNTRLIGGASEPIYLPADDQASYSRIVFTRDYVASSLHEVAHWCVAGEARRQLEDYGYWYAPDGRSVEQQSEFELVEVKPQALEWIFSVAAGLPFRVSADNIESGLGASEAFKAAIFEQQQKYLNGHLNDRSQRLIDELSHRSGVAQPLNSSHYELEKLR